MKVKKAASERFYTVMCGMRRGRIEAINDGSNCG